MKRKLFGLLLCICLMLSLSVPVMAYTEYGSAYDVTDLMDSSFMTQYGQQYLPAVSKEIGIDLRVDIVDDLEGYTMKDYAKLFFDGYGYGADYNHSAMLLMICVGYGADDDLTLTDYCVYCEIEGERDEAFEANTEKVLEIYLNTMKWDGALDDDRYACEGALELFAAAAIDYVGGTTEVQAQMAPTAASELSHVTDTAYLLTDEEIAELKTMAEAMADKYHCGIYIVTLANYYDYGSTPQEATEYIYETYNLGYGDDKDGLILMMSMADRDYYLKTYGSFGNYAFSEYCRSALEEAFLDDFGDDDWYDGFQDYLEDSEKYLKMAAEGEPFSADNDPMLIALKIAIVVILPVLIAYAICRYFKGQMLSVVKKQQAADYMVTDTASLNVRSDSFLYRTEHVRIIEDKDSDGDSSGGGGKF